MLEKTHELVNVPFKMKLDAIPAKRATFTALELGQSGKQLRATVNASTIRLGCLQQLIIDSIRCAISGKFCNLSAPELSLRDRSGVSFSDQQQPWTLMPNNPQTMHFSRALDTNLPDPFDTLPIKMVFKSKQLLCYCTYTGEDH
jgi:hypothetical protein